MSVAKSNTMKFAAVGVICLLLGVAIGYEVSVMLTPAPSTTTAEIKIGALYPLTGAQAEFGKACIAGIRLSVDLLNTAGGIKSMGGSKLRLIVADSQSDATVAKSEAERLISVEGVKAIIGSFSSTLSFAATEVSERYKVIYMETSGSAPEIMERGFKYVFRVCPNHMWYGPAAVNFTIDMLPKLNKTISTVKVAILNENSLFGTGLADGFRNGSKANGLNIVFDESYSASTTDLSAAFVKIKAASPDVLFWPNYLNDVLLGIKTMKQLDCYIPAIIGCGGPGLPVYINNAGDDGLYMFCEGYWNTDYKQADCVELRARWAEAYPSDAPTAWLGPGYVGVNMLARMFESAASTDSDKLRTAALAIDIPKVPGLVGYGVKFLETGQNDRATFVMSQWQKNATTGKYWQTTVWPADWAVGGAVIPKPR